MPKSVISFNDIYDKNINILVGSGASFGLFPTLALKISDTNGEQQTIETLATLFDKTKDSDPLYTLLFLHYYKECVDPVLSFDLTKTVGDVAKEKVVENYERLLETILSILQKRKQFEKRCNVFTTNYDGCFALVADAMLGKGSLDFVINDGARGFNKRFVQARNFNSFVCQTGIFERHHTDIPQINVIHLHGSAYWYKEKENIRVDYSTKNEDRRIKASVLSKVVPFSNCLVDESKKIEDLPKIDISEAEKKEFWDEYQKLPIVNPTKWKFHETVFEEHYYQMLRLLSYELEKPNTVVISFGFSFSDEHILNLVRRSLSNPTLQVFVCCFNDVEAGVMEERFRHFKNVELLRVDGNLDFTTFNDKVFCLKSVSPKPDKPADAPHSDLPSPEEAVAAGVAK